MARYIDANVLKEKILAERNKIPTTRVERYSFGVATPNRDGNAMRGGIRKALRCLEQTPTANVAPRAEVAREIFEEIETAFDPTVSALFCIGEVLVDVSKSYISEEEAFWMIRKYMTKSVCSRRQLQEMLSDLRKKYESEGAVE